MDGSSSSMNTQEDLALEMSDAPEALRVKITSTNEPLSELEVVSFNDAVLCRLEAQLSEADEQISELRATLLAKEEKRKCLLETLDRCRGVLSLMRGFPSDVLVEVFKWYCQGFDVFRTKAGPWHLAQMCSRWRHIVFDAPSLWSDFRLNSVDDVKFHRESMHMLQTCLAQSASVPLTIYFHMHSEDPDLAASARCTTPFRLNLELLNTVMEHSERWRDVDLVILPRLMSHLDKISGKLPLLETLNLAAYRHSTFQPESSYPVVDGFRIAPRLTAVALKETVFERIHLPLPQLEILSFEWNYVRDDEEASVSGTSMDRLHYLVDCPNLRVLKIIHDLPDDEDQDDTPSFPLSTNDSLEVLHASDHRFLDSVTLPSLRELRVAPHCQAWADQRCPPATSISMLGLLNRSQCQLEILEVMDIEDASFPLIDLLVLTPVLQELYLNYNYWNDDVDEYLADLFGAFNGRDAEALAPELRIVSITAADYATRGHVARFVGLEFDEFVRSRWSERRAGLSRIAKISIRLTMPVMLSTPRPVHTGYREEMMRCLKRYKKEGLDISIRTTGVFPSSRLGSSESHEFTVGRMRYGQTRIIYV